MVRRRLAVKRLDPWSVLKFGAVANVVLLAVFMLVAGVVWFIVDRLQLVDQVCGIADDIGFSNCGLNVGNLFRALLLLGLLWVVIQTAVFVFFAFLHNLIADLTGGLVIGVIEERPTGAVQTAHHRREPAQSAPPPRARPVEPQPRPATQPERRPAGDGRPTSGAARDLRTAAPPSPAARRSAPTPRERGQGDELFGPR